jgi:membrane protein YqaA with SNARE-associated domain
MGRLVAVWAFGEASFWFVAPDFLLLPFAMANPARWRRFAAAAWIGSLAGGAGYFVFCTAEPAVAERILAATPFVTPRMLASISAQFDQHGAWGALAQSWSFMSFKIWTFEAVRHQIPWWAYIPLVMVSRAVRLFGVSWAASRLSPALRPWWMRRPARSWTLYSCAFLLMLILIER